MSGEQRQGPYTIACPRCGSGPNVPCTNPITGRPYKSNAPHLARLTKSTKAQEVKQ